MDIRILTFNIHKGIGWGIRKHTIGEIKKKIFALEADIVFLQEIRGSQLDILTTDNWNYFAYGQNKTAKKGHYGNAILSKFPVIFSKNVDLSMHRYERRGLLHAIIDLSPRKLHLICVHLGLFENGRRKQLDFIVNYIQENIPETEPLILGGDFNDWIRYATKPLINHLQLEESFLKIRGRYAHTYPAWAPVLQLDRIYFRGMKAMQVNRLAKPHWRFLSDHIALEAHFALEGFSK